MISRGRLGILFFTVFIDLLGFGLILPIASYYAISFNATAGQVPLLGATFSAMAFIFLPFWGQLSDSIGRRPVLLISTIGSFFAYLVFGSAQSLVWLFIARGIAGVTSANIPAAQAYIADSTTPELRSKGMGLIGAAFGLGFILGPPIGGALAELGKALGLGYSLVGYGAALLSLINAFLIYRFLPESRVPSDKAQKGPARSPLTARYLQFRSAFGAPGMAILFLVFFVFVYAFANMEWTFGLLTMERLDWTSANGGERYNSYVFGVIGVIGAVTQGFLIGRLVPRFGERNVLVVGLAILAVGLGLMSVIHSIPVLMASIVLVSFGNGLCSPSLSSLVSRRAPADVQGSVLGVQQSLGALGRILGPSIGGFLFQNVGSAWPFRVGAFGMFVAWVLVVARVKDTTTAVPAAQ